MTRGVCLLLIVICACLPAFAQEKKPEKQETPHVFNHPDWTYPNKTEDRLVQVVEDMEKCVEGHLRRALIYNAGEIAKNGRAVIRQSIIDWTLDKVIFRLEGDFDFSVREVCPEALSKICDKEKITGLMAHLTSERKKNIAEELEKLPWLEDPEKVKKDVEGQIGKAKKALLKALSEDKKNSVREKCAGYLPDISVDAETVKALIDALLKDGWSIVRIQAVDSLKRIKDPSCIPALRKALEKDSYSAVRSDAAAALVAFEDKDALPLFIKGLKDGWSNVRLACMRALAEFGGKEAVNPILERLSDKKDVIREEAAIVLTRIGDATALVKLVKASGDESETVRESVYKAVAEIGKRDKSVAKKAADVLAEKGLTDKVSNPKMAAVQGLLQLGDKRGIAALVKILKEGYPFWKLSAIDVAVKENVKDPEMLKALDDLAKSDKTPPMVRQKAKEAHDKLKE